MPRTGRVALWILLLAPPALMLGLWVWSDRETFTKPAKVVTVTIPDELFGDRTESHMARGPVFGYYIGLDAVGGVSFLCAALATGLAWSRSRRQSTNGRSST